MLDDTPIAYLITWTVYGTFLQGDERGWRKRAAGEQPPQPRLAEWRSERLKHPVELLDADQRFAVETEVDRLSGYRGWRVWAKSARSNHVHVVVTASDTAGGKVRDQLKANATRVLRERWPRFVDRPVWTKGGDWRCLNSTQALEAAIVYVAEAQERKHLDNQSSAAGR